MLKSPALTISKCMTTFIYICMLTYSKEVQGQSVYLDPAGQEIVSTCYSDLRDGLDFYIFKGIVNATVTKLSNLVNFYLKTTSSSTFNFICTASLLACATPSSQTCYCAKENGPIYEIVANRSAVVSDSKASIRIQWGASGTSVVSNELQVPPIYDLSAVTTSLTLNGASMNCPATVSYDSVITFKCENAPNPCEVTISLNNNQLEKSDNIVNYTVPKSLLSNTSYDFIFSYSACGVAVTTRTCTVTIEQVTTTVTTSTTAVVNGTTTRTTNAPTAISTTALSEAPPCPLSCKDWAIALSVIYYIAIVVIGIAILVIIFTSDKKTAVFYVCIGCLVVAEVLDVILIIVFAQAGPCTCDPGSDIKLALWKIMLIIFCICNGLLIIATVVKLIWKLFLAKKNGHSTSSNTGNAEITPSSIVATSNTRTLSDNNAKSGQKALPNGNNGKGKADESYDLTETKKTSTNLSTDPKLDEAEIQDSNHSEVKKLKKKKSKKKNKDTQEQEKEGSTKNRALPLPVTIHSQAPTGTKLTSTNPYA